MVVVSPWRVSLVPVSDQEGGMLRGVIGINFSRKDPNHTNAVSKTEGHGA